MYTSVTFLLAIVASVQAANEVKEKVTFSGPGVAGVGGNGFGCADFHPTGSNSLLGCVKHVFTDGFTVGITDQATKKVTLCSIAGTTGQCGAGTVTVDLTGGTGTAPCPSGPGGTTTLTPAELSNLPIKRRSARDFMIEERSVEEERSFEEEEDME